MSEVVVTHKGWFLLCPVYFGELDSMEPIVEPWWECVRWLESVSLALFDAVVSVRMGLDPFFQPSFPLLVTGKLPAPKVIGRKDQS